jgi:hypothetical protein
LDEVTIEAFPKDGTLLTDHHVLPGWVIAFDWTASAILIADAFEAEGTR